MHAHFDSKRTVIYFTGREVCFSHELSPTLCMLSIVRRGDSTAVWICVFWIDLRSGITSRRSVLVETWLVDPFICFLLINLSGDIYGKDVLCLTTDYAFYRGRGLRSRICPLDNYSYLYTFSAGWLVTVTSFNSPCGCACLMVCLFLSSFDFFIGSLDFEKFCWSHISETCFADDWLNFNFWSFWRANGASR